MSNPVIGFIGLGIMGKPMARNLIKTGYPLVVHNRSRAAVDELRREGAQAADRSREVAESKRNCDHDATRLARCRGCLHGREGIFPAQIGNPAHRYVDHLTCRRPQTCR